MSVPYVFPGGADLNVAGIEYVDSRGERVDFHALRKTFGTMLTLSGVGQRTVMEVDAS